MKITPLNTATRFAFITALIIVFLLSNGQVVPKHPLLLMERLFPYGGWVQILIASIYGGILYYKMQDRKQRPVWRKRAWLLFSIFFFLQLFIGIVVDNIFLMTGKLHLPIPALILAGPVYRLEGLFMPILFFSTLLLSGPAWCSQLCYFGAWDAWIAGKGKMDQEQFKYHYAMRYTTFTLIIVGAIGLRLIGVSNVIATIAGISVGIIGINIICIFTHKQRKMIHCSSYCPIGTITSFVKYISPFRLKIDTTACTHCMLCTRTCRYDALHKEEIDRGKIGYTCTYCGDCLSSCKHNAIQYHFCRLRPIHAERLWILITVVLHTCFLMIARI